MEGKWQHFALGFLLAAFLFFLLSIYMTSQIPLRYSDDLVKIEAVGDNQLLALFREDVADVSVTDGSIESSPEKKSKEIYAYTTRWKQIFGQKSQKLVLLGEAESIDYVFYYPGQEENALVYKKANAPVLTGGSITLPRLTFGIYLLFSAVATLVTLLLFLFFRNSYRKHFFFYLSMLPTSVFLALLLRQLLSNEAIYENLYYLSSIVVLATLVFSLFASLYLAYNRREKMRGVEKT